MQRALTTALALLFLAACGDDDATPADDTPTGEPDTHVQPDTPASDPGPSDTPPSDAPPADAPPADAPSADSGPDVPPPPPPAEILITEFMANPQVVYDDTGEWLELLNGTDADVDLSGWTLRDDGADTHVISPAAPLVLPAGGYLVLGRSDDTSFNGGAPVAYQYADFFLANGGDEIELVNGAGEVVDRVAYDDTWPHAAGISLGMAALDLDNALKESWCPAAAPWPGGDGDRGTPGAAHVCGEIPEPPDDGCPHQPTEWLNFNQDVCPAIASGTKKVTLRNKHPQWIQAGDWAKLVCTGDKTTFEAQITEVRHTTWGEITLEEYQADGFATQEEMMETMSQYYPGITLADPATVYRWQQATLCG